MSPDWPLDGSRKICGTGPPVVDSGENEEAAIPVPPSAPDAAFKNRAHSSD